MAKHILILHLTIRHPRCAFTIPFSCAPAGRPRAPPSFPPLPPTTFFLQLAPLRRLVDLFVWEVTRESSSLLGVARSRWRHGFGWPHPRACRPSCAPPLPWAPPAESRSEAEQSPACNGGRQRTQPWQLSLRKSSRDGAFSRSRASRVTQGTREEEIRDQYATPTDKQELISCG